MSQSPEPIDLTTRVAEAIRGATADAPSGDDDDYARRAAVAAREEIGRFLAQFADTMTQSCIRLNHPGSVRSAGAGRDRACRACAGRIRAARDFAQYVSP